LNRRIFLKRTGALAALAASSRSFSEGLVPALGENASARLVDFIGTEMTARHIPGLSACLVHRDGHILWSHNSGFANLATNDAMSFEHVQNIASISKTFTTVAAMQQVEAGLLDIDADINDYLPFNFRHPAYTDEPITTRMLMRHVSGLRDGSVYARHYACGDPRMSLAVWINEYFDEKGVFYNAEENFAPWSPGDKYEYCNVAFGLLGHLVEITSGLSLPDYCERNIFRPLGMSRTRWMIADVDAGPTTTPYTWVDNNTARGPSWGGIPLGVITSDGPTLTKSLANGFEANCLYNHPNYSDGFLRTSVDQLVTWARLWLGDGETDGARLLSPRYTNEMFVDDVAAPGADNLQGLTWYSGSELNGERLWGHSGSDPGVSTSLLMARKSGLAAIVFTNTNGATPTDFARTILGEGLNAI
jgi:CubicO group peptidase (beta-lactamase class C family)